jgi:hypothetical protein
VHTNRSATLLVRLSHKLDPNVIIDRRCHEVGQKTAQSRIFYDNMLEDDISTRYSLMRSIDCRSPRTASRPFSSNPSQAPSNTTTNFPQTPFISRAPSTPLQPTKIIRQQVCCPRRNSRQNTRRRNFPKPRTQRSCSPRSLKCQKICSQSRNMRRCH